MKTCDVAVFAYSFSHKKTYDFLTYLKFFGFNNVCVIAAPKVKLNIEQTFTGVDEVALDSLNIETEALCKMLNFEYIALPHSNDTAIANFLESCGRPELALISGARILNNSIIQLFKKGVVNFHPGSIPATSGLDSFYWMIKNKSIPGTTVHFIDHKVDAGRLLFFHELSIKQVNDLSIIKSNLYQNQLAALRRFLRLLSHDILGNGTLIDRPRKNDKMNAEDKTLVLQSSSQWIESVQSTQKAIDNLVLSIQNKNMAVFQSLFDDSLLHWADNNGRSLLAMACYYHATDIAQFLIERKANVNAINDKGTTTLMYAKTKFVQENDCDNLAIIELLLNNGVDVYAKDLLGNDIFHYIPQSSKLIKVLQKEWNL